MTAGTFRAGEREPTRYEPRLLDAFLDELLVQLPALMIVGPRAAGKTTTAERRAETTIRLNSEPEAGAFIADPDAALRSLDELVLLDEWQAVPSILGAVKRAVDAQPRPGRFLLTGSVRADLEHEDWPGTGRVQRLAMYPIDRKTAIVYDALLADLFLVESIPAWTSNRLRRLVRLPKRYVVDPALVAAALHIDANGVLRDNDLLGRILDTFVAAQLRPELALSETRPRLYHLRTQGGRQEIDLLAELGGQGMIAIEVKADAAPRTGSARHLVWLRDTLEEGRFIAGIVLHTGPRLYRLDDGIIAAPISTLWGPS